MVLAGPYELLENLLDMHVDFMGVHFPNVPVFDAEGLIGDLKEAGIYKRHIEHIEIETDGDVRNIPAEAPTGDTRNCKVTIWAKNAALEARAYIHETVLAEMMQLFQQGDGGRPLHETYCR